LEAILQVIEEALESSGYQVTSLDERELGILTEDGSRYVVVVDLP
jgi:hypothetical protein